MKELSVLEHENCMDIDRVSGVFGKIMEEIFEYRKDEWSEYVRKTGFYLGKYIYILDAYEDIEKDKKAENYNCLFALSEEKEFEEKVHKILQMMISECCKNFEMLPLLQNVTILRNILYAGVWTKYYQIKGKRESGKAGKKNGSL